MKFNVKYKKETSKEIVVVDVSSAAEAQKKVFDELKLEDNERIISCQTRLIPEPKEDKPDATIANVTASN